VSRPPRRQAQSVPRFPNGHRRRPSGRIVSGGDVYTTQKGNITIGGSPQKRRRLATKDFLATLLRDVAFFFYGMDRWCPR